MSVPIDSYWVRDHLELASPGHVLQGKARYLDTGPLRPAGEPGLIILFEIGFRTACRDGGAHPEHFRLIGRTPEFP